MAQCEKCRGLGSIIEPTSPMSERHLGPCPECQGSVIVSCCDTAGASAIEVGSTYSLDGISFKVLAKGPSEPAEVSAESLFDGMRMIRETFKANISERAKNKP